MYKHPPRGIGLRFAFFTFLTWLVWSGATSLHAQNTYTSSPGKTTIYSNYDPNAPAAKAPVVSAPPSEQPFLPAAPMDQYQAQKTEISKSSQSSFPFPAAVEVSGPAPRAPTTPGPIVSTPTVSWPGITYTGLNPASPDLAVGPSDALQVVNSAIAQFTKSGTLKKTTALQDWFNDVLSATCPLNCFVFDPWIVYDHLHGRYVLLASAALSNPQARTSSFLLISVSNGATYDGGWKNWAMNASLDGTFLTQNWGDSWRLGFDNSAIYLSGNMYNVSGIFQYAKIRVVKKSDIYNPATTTLPYQEFGSVTAKLKNSNGTVADSLVPIRLRGTPNSATVGLLVSATNFNLPATYLTVWQIPNPLATAPTLNQFNISGLMSYTVPAPAPQLAQSVALDSGDARMLKAIYRSGFLYTARDTGYTDQATTVTYDVIDTTATPMKISTQSRLLNVNVFYPAFDVPATVPLGTPFASTNLIAGTTTAPDGTLTYAGISNNLKAGESPFFTPGSCSPCRWGDYFGGTIDPVSGGLWASGQYAKLPLAGGVGQWGTWAGFYPWVTTPAFNDVPSSSSFSDYINVLSSWQITKGCSANPPMFCPTNLVTRDQLATLIIRSMLGDTFTYSPTPHFTDVPASSAFFPYIQKLADLGLTHGCSPTAYCPTGTVPRMDASVLIVRAKLEALFGDTFTYPTTPFFTDVPATLPQFPYIQKMFELGLTTGCTATQFCPNSNLTRQEISVFLTRAFLN
jgi:hypothetical protein